jgi:hypothetical protein
MNNDHLFDDDNEDDCYDMGVDVDEFDYYDFVVTVVVVDGGDGDSD